MPNLLSILIPTYNRAEPLCKNLNMLMRFIQVLDVEHEVNIIVSDNCSPDDTSAKVAEIQRKSSIIELFQQEDNIGLEANAVFVLEKSSSDYVMYLGDDDFIELNYLKEVLRYIKEGGVSLIVPSFIAKTLDGKTLGYRDLGSRIVYSPGYGAVKHLFLKGHQLSGLVFKREGTLEKYLEDEKLRNIYLFKFFVGLNCYRGTCIHLKEFPVEVTVGERKDWNYGKDALFSHAIKNVHILYKKDMLHRFLLENILMVSHLISTLQLYASWSERWRSYGIAVTSVDLSLWTKVYQPLFLSLFLVKKVINRLFQLVGIY